MLMSMLSLPIITAEVFYRRYMLVLLCSGLSHCCARWAD